jgi:hypothetical protein
VREEICHYEQSLARIEFAFEDSLHRSRLRRSQVEAKRKHRVRDYLICAAIILIAAAAAWAIIAMTG